MIPVRRVRFPYTSATLLSPPVPRAGGESYVRGMDKKRALLVVVFLVLLAVLARKVRDV